MQSLIGKNSQQKSRTPFTDRGSTLISTFRLLAKPTKWQEVSFKPEATTLFSNITERN